MMIIKDRFIPKEEFMRLLFTKIDGVDTHELSMWLKSQTDDEWVVMPRAFCVMTVTFFEEKAKENSGTFLFYEEVIQELKELKKYL